jgi:hypothetical protein
MGASQHSREVVFSVGFARGVVKPFYIQATAKGSSPAPTI